METQQMTEASNAIISSAQLLEHWQGQRRLTRKVIEAYPEDKFFDYTIGGMRPFAQLLMEVLDVAGSGIEGIATGNWKSMDQLSHVTGNGPKTKQEILQQWDALTEQIDQLWLQITPERFQEKVLAFGAFEGPVYSTLLYFNDNEIHHRAQAYVYLRSLGISPPPFWDRN